LDLNSAVNLRRSLPLFIFLILFGDKNITYSPGTNFGEQYSNLRRSKKPSTT
jgi:hypothetical protein